MASRLSRWRRQCCHRCGVQPGSTSAAWLMPTTWPALLRVKLRCNMTLLPNRQVSRMEERNRAARCRTVSAPGCSCRLSCHSSHHLLLRTCCCQKCRIKPAGPLVVSPVISLEANR